MENISLRFSTSCDYIFNSFFLRIFPYYADDRILQFTTAEHKLHLKL